MNEELCEYARENERLKKQLEKKYEKVGTLTGELLYEENTKLINQQKEFIQWLENNLILIDNIISTETNEDRRYHVLIRKTIFDCILSKYKEIVGVKDE